MTTTLIEAASRLRAWLRDETKAYHEDQLLDLSQDVAASLDDLEVAGPLAHRIEIQSIVKSRDLEPTVIFQWGQSVGECTPAEARAHALRVLEAAEAAESDAFLLNFLMTRASLPVQAFAPVLADFRAWREQRAQAETEAVTPAGPGPLTTHCGG